jgi:hypothetical protein
MQTDAYQETGCYNLHCSGFVQTNSRIAIGAAISPTSVYNGRQFDISLLIWKVRYTLHTCARRLLQLKARRSVMLMHACMDVDLLTD